jgi:DNA-binding ferritin-like protein
LKSKDASSWKVTASPKQVLAGEILAQGEQHEIMKVLKAQYDAIVTAARSGEGKTDPQFVLAAVKPEIQKLAHVASVIVRQMEEAAQVNPLRWKQAAFPFAPATPAADASETIWQDPSSYNPYTQGPPYLPEVKMARVASVQDVTSIVAAAPDTALPAILTLLRALAMVHQSHHWLTYGPAFYGDHILFERLYNDIVGEIDQVAERAVGMGASKTALHPGAQAAQVARIVEALCGNGVTFGEGENPDVYVSTSLRAERWFLDCMKQLSASLSAVNQLSRGTDNLLQGIEDKHEEHVYLLIQRTGGDKALKVASNLVWKT